MLAVLIYIADIARRVAGTLARSASIIAESFREAQKIRRAMPRVYIEE